MVKRTLSKPYGTPVQASPICPSTASTSWKFTAPLGGPASLGGLGGGLGERS